MGRAARWSSSPHDGRKGASVTKRPRRWAWVEKSEERMEKEAEGALQGDPSERKQGIQGDAEGHGQRRSQRQAGRGLDQGASMA